jgi:sulfite exporter TauE/SafE
MHIHSSHEVAEEPSEETDHHFFRPGKPFFRLKSFLIGIVHGLAGSAAVMLAVLVTDAVTSFWVGLFYIVLFGLGTVMSMGMLTVLMGIPFAISGQFQRVNAAVASIAGTLSIAFGVFLMYELAIVEGF